MAKPTNSTMKITLDATGTIDGKGFPSMIAPAALTSLLGRIDVNPLMTDSII